MSVKVIPDNFLSNSKVRNLLKETPIHLNDTDEEHILVFRRVLEVAISQGRWYGMMPEVS